MGASAEEEGAPKTYSEKDRYTDAMPGAMSVVTIVFGILWMNDCSAIETLPYFLIVNGVLNIANAAFKFWFRIPMDPKLQDPNDTPTKISGIGGIAGIFCAIWGAVLTFGHAADGFAGSLECNETLFITGFVSSAIPLMIVVGMAAMAIAGSLQKKPDGNTAMQADEAAKV